MKAWELMQLEDTVLDGIKKFRDAVEDAERRAREAESDRRRVDDELNTACDQIEKLTSELGAERKAAQDELQMRLKQAGNLRALWQECRSVLCDVQSFHPRDPKDPGAPPVIDLLKQDRPDIYARLVAALLREEGT